MNAVSGLIETETATDFAELKILAKLRSGKLISMSGDMKMKVAQDGEKTEVSVKYEMTNIKTGDDVKITAPENLDEYK